jgi:hypothetical protein
MGVVAPKEVVGDDSAGRVHNGDGPDERERFIGLEV